MLRFPADFMFQLSREEFDSLRSLFQQVKLIHSRGSMDNLTHFDVSGILETWKFPLRVLKILNDLNGAKRWNGWNHWNGPIPPPYWSTLTNTVLHRLWHLL